MRKLLEKFYHEHTLFVFIILMALVLRTVNLNYAIYEIGDESYYLPAARGILANGIDTNREHPPLVKLILAGSIALFGDTPLSWRIPSAVMGMVGLSFFYFVALELFKEKRLAAISTGLLAVDPLHVLLSRLAMLDIFMLGFVLAGVYFILKQNFIPAGVFFGLGLASKWPALLPLFAVSVFLGLQKKIRPPDFACVLITVGLMYFFVNVPFIISQGPAAWFSSQLQYTTVMTHSSTASPYGSSGVTQQSMPFEWLYGQKPEWFMWDRPGFSPPPYMLWFAYLFGGKPALGVIVLGNPIFWIPAFVALFWLAFQKSKESTDVRAFAILWFIFTFVPFLLIPRTNMYVFYMLLVLPAYALSLSLLLVSKNLVRWYMVILGISLFILLPLAITLPVPEAHLELLRPLIGPHPP